MFSPVIMMLRAVPPTTVTNPGMPHRKKTLLIEPSTAILIVPYRR